MATKNTDPGCVPGNNHGPNHTQFKKEDTFCDITIKVQDKVFKAHKVVLAASSDFFRAMFTSGFQEQQSSEITLKHGNSDIFESLLDFIYTGNFNMDQTSVETFEMAIYYQIHHAICACADYLAKHLAQHLATTMFRANGSDQSSVQTMSEELGRIISHASDARQEKLLEAIDGYMKAQLHQFVSDGIQSNMPMGVLSVILDQKEELAVLYSEEKILRMVVAWLNYDLAFRKTHANHLMKKIRLGVVPITTLQSIFTGTLLEISACKVLYDRVVELCNKHDEGASRCKVSLRYSHPELFAPRSTITALVVIGEHPDDQSDVSFVQYYDEVEDRWTPLANLPRLPSDLESNQTFLLFYPSAIVVKGNLYIAGGEYHRDYHKDLQYSKGIKTNKVHRYCADTNTWEELPSMYFPRFKSTLVHLGDYIYAIGGEKTHTPVEINVERFHIDKEEWEILPPETWDHRPPVAPVAYRGHILIYESDYKNEIHAMKAFFPESNTWKYVRMDQRISGNGGSMLAFIDDRCYDIRFEFEELDSFIFKFEERYKRIVTVVNELLLDLDSDPSTWSVGDEEDQSGIECDEVRIKGDLYAIMSIKCPGNLHKKKPGSTWSSFGKNQEGHVYVGVAVCYSFDKLGLI